MTIPTTVPYPWATGAGRRVSAITRAVTGWVAGRPVPAGENNSLFGILSDWATWLHGTAGIGQYVPLGLLPWTVAVAGGSTATVAASGATDLMASPWLVELTLTLATGTGSASAFATFAVPPGLISGMTVRASSAAALQSTVTVRVHSSAGVLLGTFEADPVATSPADLVLIGTALDLDGPAWATIAVRAAYSSGLGAVTAGRLRIARSAP